MITATPVSTDHGTSSSGSRRVVTTRTTITPDYAARLLQENKHNRRLSKTTIARYAQAMKTGGWIFNGESIKISWDNIMLDGQHRLYGCIESGEPFETLVITGLSPSVFSCLDIGKRRTASDVLGISGYANATTVAAAVNIIVQLRSGKPIQYQPKNGLSNAEVLEYAQEMIGIDDACAFMKSFKSSSKMIGPGFAAGFLYECRRSSHGDKADEFFTRLFDGIGLTEQSPIRLLRERLIANMTGKAKLQRKMIGAFIIKAWNSYVLERPIKVLRHSDDEAFPRLAK